MTQYINIAAYKFVALDNLESRQSTYKSLCRDLDLKGTILLSPEGINLFVAGTRENINSLLDSLRGIPGVEELEVKESVSDHQPFSRMLVKVKKEIIAFGVEGIEPAKYTSRRVTASQLKEWLDNGEQVELLDVRNDFEFELGTFDNAHAIGIDDFRAFPEAVENLPDDWREKKIVTFCTGGIRCEKAGPLMEQKGFKEVFQLDGGILKYFEEIGSEHYHGECFVFDKRVALDASLQETDTSQCYACLTPLHASDRESPSYVPGQSCPHCFVSNDDKWLGEKRIHQLRINNLVSKLPGSVAYDNVRPVHVPGTFEDVEAIEFLTGHCPRMGREKWLDIMDRGELTINGTHVTPDQKVRAGQRLDHLIPDTIEPDVSGDIKILYEDQAIIVIDKPAPLPMHPAGRFNRNTLSWIVGQAYEPDYPRIVHRLDANTSGIVVLARTRRFAMLLQREFQLGRVDKIYQALIKGVPEQDNFSCQTSISVDPQRAGARIVDEHGVDALTKFRVMQWRTNGITLVEARPVTGRTNQIRIHCWDMNMPIQGDPLYLSGKQLGETQTIALDDPPMCLHAHSIAFNHPDTGEAVKFESSQPKWLRCE